MYQNNYYILLDPNGPKIRMIYCLLNARHMPIEINKVIGGVNFMAITCGYKSHRR